VTRLIAALLLVVLPTQALADGLKHIPPWKMCGDKACYEFSDAKKLLVLDADLEALIQKEVLWEKQVKDLRESNALGSLALAAEKSANNTLKENNEKLNAMLVKETTRANKAEAKPGPFPAWVIAGGVGVAVGVVAGIVLGVYVAKKP
jgi:septum formation inhibitor MinC